MVPLEGPVLLLSGNACVRAAQKVDGGMPTWRLPPLRGGFIQKWRTGGGRRLQLTAGDCVQFMQLEALPAVMLKFDGCK